MGDQYSWLSSIFYFGYLLWEYPTTILIQKVPVGKYLSCSVAAWGAVVAGSAASNNFAALAATRFLIGFLEATTVPSFVYIISQWYTRDEAPVRTGIWFVGTDIGAVTAALIIYGLGHAYGTIETWRLMFIVSTNHAPCYLLDSSLTTTAHPLDLWLHNFCLGHSHVLHTS